MPLPLTNTEGLVESPARAVASSEVPSVLLSRMTFFRSSVHLLSPMPAPARCTTASMPSRLAASMVPPAGSHWISSAPAFAARRTKAIGRWPCDVSDAESAVPMRPDAPVIAISMLLSSQVSGVHAWLFRTWSGAGPYGDQRPRRWLRSEQKRRSGSTKARTAENSARLGYIFSKSSRSIRASLAR